MIRVIDIETTGTDPATDEIIEIASVDMVRGGGITNAMDTLVRPAGPIPTGASAVHHLIDEDVRNAPSLTEVIGRFAGADFYVAHNAEFERSFFAAKGIALGPWICTYKCALRVWPDLDGHSNQELRYALGRASPFPGFERTAISPHRAASDVIVTAAVFEELIKQVRWSDLVQWSVEPACIPGFTSGSTAANATPRSRPAIPTISAGLSRSRSWKKGSSTVPSIGWPLRPPLRHMMPNDR